MGLTKTYHLPAAIAAALATNRSQLCVFYATEVDDPEKQNLALLIGDLLEDRQELSQKTCELGDRCKQVAKQLESFQRACQDMIESIQGANDERGITPGEVSETG